MRLNLSISPGLIRTAALSLLFAASVLWGIDKAASSIQLALTGDPLSPSSQTLGHPHLLWEMPPGSIEVKGQRVNVNNIGARGPTIEIAKPTGIRRVISLGGDVAFGGGVERSETYSIDAINSLGGSRVGVETILLAMPEYTIVQTINLMAMRGWALDPDLLIFSGPGHEMDVAPYVDQDVISKFKNNVGISQTLQNTALYQILDHWLRVTSGPKANRRQRVFQGGANTNPTGLPRVGTNVYAEQLDRLVHESIEKQVDVVFLIPPVPADVTDAHLDDRVLLYRDAMRHIAKRHGVPTVDGPNVFIESGRTQAELFGEGATLTKRGHRLLSYALSQTLRPWMRGRKLNKKGTGADIPVFKEPKPNGAAL